MPQRQKPPPLHIVIVGHVDHGKSTFIGRLLYDTDSLPAGKYDALKKVCKDRGTEALEWSFLLDAFQAERNQAITIDTTQIGFSTQERDYVIIDAPGHREFIKNMISGAAQADGAILVVDATQGVREQTRRHAYLLSLLGLTQISVVINKMDMVGYDAEIFANVRTEITAYLKSIGLKSLHILPISARHGDMIAARGEHLKWYNGPCLTEALDSFHHAAPEHKIPLRFPVQDVYRFDGKRIVVGRVETGTLCVGDRILFSPTNEQATIARTKYAPWQVKVLALRLMKRSSWSAGIWGRILTRFPCSLISFMRRYFGYQARHLRWAIPTKCGARRVR
jgi:bifunctional enzyme CysN/CysC